MSNKPETKTVNILQEESGIEILVNYTKNWEDQVEDFHGHHDMFGYSFVINCIELVIAGEGLNITKQVSLKQYRAIMNEVAEMDQEHD